MPHPPQNVRKSEEEEELTLAEEMRVFASHTYGVFQLWLCEG